MARNVKFSFLRGGGSSLEVLYGKVSLTPTNLHTFSSTAVLPAPTTFDLVNGTALATNVAPSPAPVEGQVPWAYKVKITDNFGKSWEYLVGVPDGTSEINFNDLPRYFETKPPLYGVGPAGPAGQAATITIGTTTSGITPNVSNTGTSKDAILNFTLAKGDKGDTGTGVPTGGTALQTIRKNVNNTATEWVTFDKSLVGLPKVDNTSDAEKPLSTPQKTYVDNYVAAQAAAGKVPNKFVEGVPLYSMGHSYTMYPYPYATKYTGEYYARVKERLSLGALWAKGRSGTFAIDNFGRMLSAAYDGGSGTWSPNAYGICVIQNTMNELGSSNSSDSLFRGMWEHGIRSQVQLMRSKSIISAVDMTAVGTWDNLNTNSIGAKKGYNLISRFSNGVGASLSAVVTGDECSVVGYINPDTYGAQDIEVLVNGTVRATFTCKGAKHATQVDAVTKIVEVLTPVAFRMKGLNAWAGTSGNKTVLVRRKTGAAAENIFISAVLIPSEAPPMIFLVKEPPRAGSAVGTYTANIAYYNSRLDAIASEYDNVFTVDFAPGWDNTKMIGSLDVVGGSFHPNDIGHSLMADHLTAAINTRINTWVNGVVVL